MHESEGYPPVWRRVVSGECLAGALGADVNPGGQRVGVAQLLDPLERPCSGGGDESVLGQEGRGADLLEELTRFRMLVRPAWVDSEPYDLLLERKADLNCLPR